MHNITLILLTKNEQENLSKWGDWIDKLIHINEIIVIDSSSTDNTKLILKSLESKRLKIKIFDKKFNDNFANLRNFAVKHAINDWILFLDADEIPSSKLINYLNKLNLDNNCCYSIKRYLVYLNKVVYHGVSTTDNPIRLFNRNSGKFTGLVHEVWATSNKQTTINFPIFHYSAPNLKTFLNKLNNYSTIRAQELFKQKTKVNLFDIIIYPTAKFIQYYFWHLGFVDGIPGVIICLSMSFYSFLVRCKLWQLYHV